MLPPALCSCKQLSTMHLQTACPCSSLEATHNSACCLNNLCCNSFAPLPLLSRSISSHSQRDVISQNGHFGLAWLVVFFFNQKTVSVCSKARIMDLPMLQISSSYKAKQTQRIWTKSSRRKWQCFEIVTEENANENKLKLPKLLFNEIT